MKYEFTGELLDSYYGILSRTRALRDIARYGVRAGDLGGFIKSEANLSQEGDCWVSDDAQVHGDAQVFDNAEVHGNARVFNKAQICGNAQVHGCAQILSDK